MKERNGRGKKKERELGGESEEDHRPCTKRVECSKIDNSAQPGMQKLNNMHTCALKNMHHPTVDGYEASTHAEVIISDMHGHIKQGP